MGRVGDICTEDRPHRFVFFLLIEADWCLDASVRKASLIEIMACHLFTAKPLSEPMMAYCYPKSENVTCTMAGILSQSQCVGEKVNTHKSIFSWRDLHVLVSSCRGHQSSCLAAAVWLVEAWVQGRACRTRHKEWGAWKTRSMAWGAWRTVSMAWWAWRTGSMAWGAWRTGSMA